MSIQTRITDPSPLGPGNAIWLHTHEFSGELIGELVPLDAPPLGSPRIPIRNGVDGVIVVQPLFKLVRSGQR